MSQRHPRKPPATFVPALHRGDTAPFPCWPTVFGLVLHRQVPPGGPPWRIERKAGWTVSDPVTGYRIVGGGTPRSALRELRRLARFERKRLHQPFAAVVADVRRRIIDGEVAD